MKSIPNRQSAGIALVIVLSFLVILTALMVGFLSSVTSQKRFSKTVASAASTQQLAESAVNVVMAQIVDATKGQDSKGLLAWASQPGMIRTFDLAGQPKDFFKLYSSDAMVVSGAGFDAAKEIPPPTWNTPANLDIYTDLNAPGVDSNGFTVYPILHPGADGTPDLGSDGKPVPDKTNVLKVDGFAITDSPGYQKAKAEGVGNNRAPMPARWLYVLKDGSLKSAEIGGTNGTVQVYGATEQNPIVGRIAFWTDDEAAKVNINTASEGTFWDVPRIYSAEDFGSYAGTPLNGYANAQPVRREYERYPGHPATTSLSAVFGTVLPVSTPYPPNPGPLDAAKLDPYYALTPRVGLSSGTKGGGGSRGGSTQVASTAQPFALDVDRLYASIDELMFQQTLSGSVRVRNAIDAQGKSKFTKGILGKAKFFLTANSSAPETTLYNTPRLAVWPVYGEETKKTTFDSLLAFCSTVNKKAYHFTRTARTGARSSTVDFSAGSRNLELYAYLQALTKTDVPGFGGNFLAKYPASTASGSTGISDRDQLLVNICDYIRSTNLQDQTLLPTGAPVQSYTPLFSVGAFGGSNGFLGAGEVIPLRIGRVQGFGRFLSITTANLLFYGTGKDASGKVNKMRALFFFGFTSPQQGMACMRANVKYKVVTGLQNFRASGKPLNFKHDQVKGNGTNFMDLSDLDVIHGRSVGGTESPWQAIKDKPFEDADAGAAERNKYPFFSGADVDIDPAATQFEFTGATVDVEIRAVDTDQVVQTLHFNFPSGIFKKPGFFGNGTFKTRASGNWTELVKNEDTLVALQVGGTNLSANATIPSDAAQDATAGDIRMTAGLVDVPANRFRPDKNYSKPGVQFAHSLVMSTGLTFLGGTYGNLVSIPYPSTPSSYTQDGGHGRQPDVPSRVPLTGVTRIDGGPGDWDTGFGDQKDGAHINKPDEGDTALTDSAGGTRRMPYMLGYRGGFASATNTYFSPNRQIPSPLVLGSIPTGVQRMQPWQTLLFHPRPESPNHPGNASPKDHLIADLFWMPVVEPYAISQPFATSGKINMNYQIIPFSYIKRATGLHAVMKSTKFAALNPAIANVYKPLDYSSRAPTAPNSRRFIDLPKTLAAFDAKFAKNEVFKSASQICEINLVPPEVANDAGMKAFWLANQLTGDNLREKPYVDLYSRITTKSNTFTVHLHVQTLSKAPGTPPEVWVAGRDQVVGEYRGSAILERYIDVNDPTLPDFATAFAADPKDSKISIDQYYKMRVVSTKRFVP